VSDPLDQLRQHFTGLWVREEGPQGRVYVGHDAGGAEVTIAVLAAPLAEQPAIRNAFADVVWRHSVGSQPGRSTVYAADLHAPRPWAAARALAGQPGAEQLFTVLAGTAPTGAMPAAPPPPPPTSTFQGYPAYPSAPPARSGSPLPWVLGGAAVLVVLLAAAAVIGVIALRDGDTGPPVTQPTTPPTQSPVPTESPAPEPTDEPTGEPALRDVEQVSLVGPNFALDEDTWTMAFEGWPFAFRGPKDWTCAHGQEIPRIPDADPWACFGGPESGEQGGVMLWECDADCDEEEQQEKIDTWLDEPDQAVQWGDSPTYYVETEENDDGLYTIDLGHFFGTGSEELRWMVGVYVEAPSESPEDVQKVLNDILSQAG
jgi:hypothetical protein